MEISKISQEIINVYIKEEFNINPYFTQMKKYEDEDGCDCSEYGCDFIFYMSLLENQELNFAKMKKKVKHF